MGEHRAILGLALVALAAASARGQLAESDVLLVYDSRVPDGLAIAEHYAGSAKVPGGVGAKPGVRPGVHVFDIGSVDPNPFPDTGNLPHRFFGPRIRDRIRLFLTTEGLVHQVRCIVLTKGLPHRIQDSDDPTLGDRPLALASGHLEGDANCASVDAELTLLWQDLDAGENGGRGDSFSDGYILNPYHRAVKPIMSFSSRNSRVPKPLAQVGVQTGAVWRSSPTAPVEQQLLAGDLVLVSRLDGPDAASVIASIDRAQNLVYDTDTAAFVIDESESDGVANPGANAELDNQAGITRAGDDFELSRDALLADGRFDPALVYYDAASNRDNFIVGPNVDYSGQGILVKDPVALLAHYGQNHQGAKPLGPEFGAADTYAASFDYADGAIFNTVESYNGRALGTLTTLFNQEQVSDFIAAGGTFGLGHVWEPLPTTLPDNRYLVQNFVLGNLSWVEAAYTSMPVLSWMQIVIGDPLARVTRSGDDINGDGRVDVDDMIEIEQEPADINRDGAADATDRALVERSARGTVVDEYGPVDRP